jgi:hypothetical protein
MNKRIGATMNKALDQYRQTRVGQQLLSHFEDRAALRRSIPLFPFSLSTLFSHRSLKRSGTKKDTCQHQADAACQG